MNRFLLSALVLVLAAFHANAAPVFTDPAGDVFNPPGPDIVSYSGDNGTGNFVFTATFAGPIAPPSAFALNSVGGFIDLDTDRNAATGGNAVWGANQPGGNSWINFAVANGFLPGPPIALGDEFFVDLFSEAFQPGLVGLFRTSDGGLVGNVPIAFTANSFTVTINPALLGNPGQFNYGIYAGDLSLFSGDRAPNGAIAAVTTPEPGTLAAFGLMFAAAAGYYRRSRRPAVAA